MCVCMCVCVCVFVCVRVLVCLHMLIFMCACNITYMSYIIIIHNNSFMIIYT